MDEHENGLGWSESLLRGYLDHSSEAIWCFELNPPMSLSLTVEEQIDYIYDHARVAVANAAWAAQAGYAGWEEMIGLPLDALMPRRAPENMALLRKLSAVNYAQTDLVSQDLSADGRMLTVLNTHSAEIRDGLLVRSWGTLRDITREEHDRARLHEAEAKYRSVVENANEAIIVSQDGLTRFWNAQAKALLGYSDDDMRSARFEDFVCPDDLALVQEHYRKRLAGEESTARYTVRLITRDGRTKWVIVSSALVDWEGHPASLVMLSDITERVEARQEAHRQRDALERVSRTAGMDQLAGSIAHELNQPLTGILSNAQAGEMMIERDMCSCNEMTEVIREIVADTKRAGDIIRNLRDIYRKQSAEMEVVDLTQVVQDTLSMLHSEFVLQDVNLDVQMPETPTVVQGNRVQLQQVLLNLLSNGVEAMQTVTEREHSMVIVVDAVAGNATLAVEDRGSGIGSERIDRIFEPLATWKPGGTGMGLAISSSIIKAHGGSMWAVDLPAGGARVGFTIALNGVKK
jgi:two-component system sensor kinase FixL